MEFTKESKPEWSKMLQGAVDKPGTVHAAYSSFHNYSLCNAILALMQCSERGVQPGPLACFNAWKDRGRYVKKGERAIVLCMPLTRKRKETAEDGTETESFSTFFAFKKNWFVLSQTEGAEYVEPAIPNWDKSSALRSLNVEEIPFTMLTGNTMGYATGRSIAISPLAFNPAKTTFHELAHVVLGHTEKSDVNDTESIPRDIREVEAECVALICLESLGIDGAEHARGYIQGWLAGNTINDRTASRIFEAANTILKAGVPCE